MKQIIIGLALFTVLLLGCNNPQNNATVNKHLTYFTLNMPKKVIARQVAPQYDFAAFDFDAEKVNTDKDYLIIYVNREKRKVKKSAVKFVFEPWK
ncbi:hypothetical protein [Pedobacter heparinus]|uniref:hypothetical protein n=1 Tax=Pedobacter heparinus TaxID=984 RepID=UPI00292D1C44|nr:hypothetical protein [Pedobacter heparinus]